MILRTSILLVLTFNLASPNSAEKQDPEKGKRLKVMVVIGRAPEIEQGPGGENADPTFKPGKPLDVKGKVVRDRELRAAVKKGIKYILDQQRKNGSWKFKPGKPGRGGYQLSMDPATLTTVACLALQAHEALDPVRIRKAVRRGRDYLMRSLPGGSREPDGIWTWSFFLFFLKEEFDRTKDARLREAIRKKAREVANRLLETQHKGKMRVPKEGGSGGSRKGFLGIMLLENENKRLGGVRVARVYRQGPAGMAGIRMGDVILKINGKKVRDLGHFTTLIDSFAPGDTVSMTLLRTGNWKPPRQEGPPDGPGPGGGTRADGGWCYLPGPAASFTTATALLALYDAKELGARVSKESLDRGALLLLALRRRCPSTKEYGYLYANQPEPFDIRGSMGRIAVVELALLRTGRHKVKSLDTALEIFRRRRGELDRVRGYPRTHHMGLYKNAAYYWLFGHYFAARATRHSKNEKTKKACAATIQEALLKIQHKDGTWTDFVPLGKLVGTSLALMGLGELKWLNPRVYK